MEYARFGDGWVKRVDASAEWEPCEDVPEEVIAERVAARVRRQRLGYSNEPSGGVSIQKGETR